jgi:hypothetical protein
MKKYRKIIFILFLVINFLSFKNVDLPLSPEVKEPKFEENNENLFLVEINLIGENSFQGYIKFKSKKVIFNIDNKKNFKTIDISKIKSIKFLLWKGKQKRKNSYAFYPDKIEIRLFDKTKFISYGNVYLFNKFYFIKKKGKNIRKLFSYYYDYLEKGRWVNSNTEEISFVEKNPLKKTVKEIIFTGRRDASFQIFKKLFRNFK